MNISTARRRARATLAAAAVFAFSAALLVGAAEAASHHEADRERGTIVLAHAGQLSPKDGCHKQKSAGERHWHVAGSAERGGECIKRDGKTVYMLEMEAPLREVAPAKVTTPWGACTAQWYELERTLDAFWSHGLGDDALALMNCLRRAYPQQE
ncbi:MAG: hypothetical protein OXK73_12325 [Rhodospirillaceae bacterium]|nr:hypothetical protein [Rhodospirillaceae bacterium]